MSESAMAQTPPPPLKGAALVVGDFTGDNKPDIAVGSDGSVTILLNENP